MEKKFFLSLQVCYGYGFIHIIDLFWLITETAKPKKILRKNYFSDITALL